MERGEVYRWTIQWTAYITFVGGRTAKEPPRQAELTSTRPFFSGTHPPSPLLSQPLQRNSYRHWQIDLIDTRQPTRSLVSPDAESPTSESGKRQRQTFGLRGHLSPTHRTINAPCDRHADRLRLKRKFPVYTHLLSSLLFFPRQPLPLSSWPQPGA